MINLNQRWAETREKQIPKTLDNFPSTVHDLMKLLFFLGAMNCYQLLFDELKRLSESEALNLIDELEKEIAETLIELDMDCFGRNYYDKRN